MIHDCIIHAIYHILYMTSGILLVSCLAGHFYFSEQNITLKTQQFVTPIYTHVISKLGQTQTICCFSDPPVHWSLKNVRKILGNRKYFFWNRPFVVKKISIFIHFLRVFPFIFIPLGPLKWFWERSKKQHFFS